MQTVVEQLMIDLYEKGHLRGDGSKLDGLLEKYKEIEKQQIIDAYYGYELYLDREFRFQQGGQAKILTFDQWYETYGSKGSDEHIVDTNEMVCYTKQDVIDAIIKIHEIYSLHGQYNDTLEAKKLRLKGVSWHIQNILESLKKDKI